MLKYLAFVITTFILFICTSHSIYAGHFVGGEITYTCVDDPNTPDIEFEVKVGLYRDCNSYTAPNSITIEATSASGCTASTSSWTFQKQVVCGKDSTGINLFRICSNHTSKCDGGTAPGNITNFYCGTIALPANCPDWNIEYGICCRSFGYSNYINYGNEKIYLNALINTTNNWCNNSPYYTNYPDPLVWRNYPNNFNYGTIETDGDSVVFELVAPLDSQGVPLTYIAPYSPTYPLPTVSGTFPFNNTTGQITFTTPGAYGAVIIVLVKEYRQGVLVGSVLRELGFFTNGSTLTYPLVPNQFIMNNTVRGGKLLDSVTLRVPFGNTLNFTIKGIDPNQDPINFSTNINEAFQGVTNPPTYTATWPTWAIWSDFSWETTQADIGRRYFVVNFTENDVCFFKTRNSTAYTIIVDSILTVFPDSTIYCGNAIQLNAYGSNGPYQWTPTTGLNNPNIPNPWAAPAVPTWYTVSTPYGQDSVFVDVQPIFNVFAGNDTSICWGDWVMTNPNVDTAFGPHLYEWIPAESFNHYYLYAWLIPYQTTTFTLKVTTSLGCVVTDTVVVSVNNPEVTLGPDRYLSCGNYCTTITATTSNNNNYTYNWSNGHTARQFTYCDTLPLTIAVEVTYSIGCSATDTVNVIVSDTLCAPGKVTICRHLRSGDYNFCIDSNRVSYYLSLGDDLGCCINAIVLQPGPGGTGGIFSQVYPNPTTLKTTIEVVSEKDDEIVIEIFNSTGQKVDHLFSGEINADQSYKIDFNRGNLPAGIYIYNITSARGEVIFDKIFIK